MSPQYLEENGESLESLKILPRLRYGDVSSTVHSITEGFLFSMCFGNPNKVWKLMSCQSKDGHCEVSSNLLKHPPMKEPKLPWILFLIAFSGMLAFAVLYANKVVSIPKTNPELDKAWKIYQLMTNATFVNTDKVLFGIESVAITYSIDGEQLKAILPEEEVRARFELTLRRFGIPINPKSDAMIVVTVRGVKTPDGMAFSTTCGLGEPQYLFRGDTCHTALLFTWFNADYTGYASSANANQMMLKAVEKCSELFANDYLAANKSHSKEGAENKKPED